MDRDMINIIHYLYHHGRISDDATKNMLQCYADTTDPLKNSKILEIRGNDWILSQGVGDFLRLAEENLQSFPPQDWVFSFPLRVPPPQPNEPRYCFVVMPYGKPWYQRVCDSIKKAAISDDTLAPLRRILPVQAASCGRFGMASARLTLSLQT